MRVSIGAKRAELVITGSSYNASMTDQQWSYYAWVVKIPDVNGLTDTMNAFGREGWEMVTSLTTVKTWLNISGNDLVFVFKKPGEGHGISERLASQLTGLDPDVAY